MMLFLIVLAALALAGIASTVVQVLHDGYGHPATLPSPRDPQYEKWPTTPSW